MTLSIPLVPPSLNGYARMHWAARTRLLDEWRETIWALWREAGSPRYERVDVRVIIYFARARRRDQDNYTATAYKLILDSLKNHLVPDDTPDHVAMHPVTWQTDSQRPRTEVVITPSS